MNKKQKSRAKTFLAKALSNPPSKPGKYDVFLWCESEALCSATVAWKSFTQRAVPLRAMTIDNKEEVLVNAAALPNGIAISEARYIGTFRVEKGPSEAEDE